MAETKKKNWFFIIGVLLLSVGLQLANYGTALCISGEMNRMGATQYYVLVAALGTLGMLLILPIVGKLTAIFGQRTMILLGIVIQTGGRVLMMLCNSWIPFAACYLLQSIGGGFYVSSAYVCMATAVDSAERTKFFSYIAVANAIGAIFGPILTSTMYAAGGLLAKLAYIANLPLTLVGFILMYKDCLNAKNPNAAKGFDYLGVILTVFGIGGLLLCMNLGGKMFDWLSLPCIILLVIAAASLIWLFKRETNIASPAVPLMMFKNKRLLSAFICAIVAAAYGTCASSYTVMWIRLNFSTFPGYTLYSGTTTLAQQIVVFILGLFLGAYIGKKFVKRFRIFGILAMVAAMVATGILYCLKFTGTAAENNVIAVGGIPLGMILIYSATAIGGFMSVVSQSAFSAFWQSNTPQEQIPSGQALYSVGATGGSAIFGVFAGLALGSTVDYSRVFLTAFVFAFIGFVTAIVFFKFSKEEVAAANSADR